MMVARQSHLLIVEEEATLAEVTAFRLELLGFSVQVARNADEAWTLLKQQKPDLMIIDLKLSGVGGVALIEQLASENETAMIPLLALSFDAELEQVQRAFSAGAADYLVAPYNPTVLEEKVERLLADAAKPKSDGKHKKALQKA
ncbi:MAG: response regulator [Pirellulaceae bacterium]|nr:response regulator [Pirellulaceae bacterium]